MEESIPFSYREESKTSEIQNVPTLQAEGTPFTFVNIVLEKYDKPITIV